MIFGRAYFVEEGLMEWKERILLMSRRMHLDPLERKVVGRAIKAIPNYGIRVGSFDKLHRQTA